MDNIVTQFNTYEDFLDSQITTLDLYYLEVRAAAPQGGHSFAFLGASRAPASWGVRRLAVDRGNGRLRSFPTAVRRGLGPYRIRGPGVRDRHRTARTRAHARTLAAGPGMSVRWPPSPRSWSVPFPKSCSFEEPGWIPRPTETLPGSAIQV